MKIITIVEDNHVVGVTYGVVEVGENIQTIKHNTKYTALQNQIKKQQRILRTKQK